MTLSQSPLTLWQLSWRQNALRRCPPIRLIIATIPSSIEAPQSWSVWAARVPQPAHLEIAMMPATLAIFQYSAAPHAFRSFDAKFLKCIKDAAALQVRMRAGGVDAGFARELSTLASRRRRPRRGHHATYRGTFRQAANGEGAVLRTRLENSGIWGRESHDCTTILDLLRQIYRLIGRHIIRKLIGSL